MNRLWFVKAWFRRCGYCYEIIRPWQKVADCIEFWGHYHKKCRQEKWQYLTRGETNESRK